MLYNCWILFKLIKNLVVLVSSMLWYASFPYNLLLFEIFKINYLT